MVFFRFFFRDDSSFNFMVFFLVFFFQMIVSALYSVGIGGIYKKNGLLLFIFIFFKFLLFLRNGFKWTVAGIRSHRKKRCQWWPDVCWGSDGHNWGWMGTGSIGRFLSIGQGAYLTTISTKSNSQLHPFMYFFA